MKNAYDIPVFLKNNNPFDDSKLIAEQSITLLDGRPVIAHVWAESGYTFLSYFFTNMDIEHLHKEEILNYLQSGGITIDNSDISYKPEINLVKDDNETDCWRVTLVIEESEE